jgi:hypothetical protein
VIAAAFAAVLAIAISSQKQGDEIKKTRNELTRDMK